MDTEQLTALAFRIADSCAASDIESNCAWVKDDDAGIAGEVVRGVGQWYDTSMDDPPGAHEWLEEALAYLDARGRLIRKEGAPHLVRIKPECERCGDTGLVTLFDVDLGARSRGDADDQPCPDCAV